MAKRDGHKVWVVGRSEASDLTSKQMNCEFLKLDRGGDLSPLWALSPDVVVDAAGPFQTYGDDPYRLPRACIENRVHYFDLCDDTAFCVGIAELDPLAKAAGIVVSSGVSSVPALSSAVVGELIKGLRPERLDVAILPGNQTPRGRSVTHSIMVQTGTEFPLCEGGHLSPTRNWSGKRSFVLPGGHKRIGRRFNLPDVHLFPDHFGIPTVVLWAGLELPILSNGLWAFGMLRHYLGLPFKPWMADFSIWFSDKLIKRGTNIGGMVVALRGHDGDAFVERTWKLTLGDGEGPFVPSTALRAALRDLDSLPPGAGPAIGLVDLPACEAAMSDLAAEFERGEDILTPAFQSVLGGDFDMLPNAVKDSHQTIGIHHFEGRAKVTRGTSLWSRILAAAFGFPKACDDISISVKKERTGGGETWTRTFGNRAFRSHLTPGKAGMSERFGPFTFDLNLHVAADALHFPVKRGRVFGIPLPPILLPQSNASEREVDGQFHFDVQILAPITGRLMVHYQGWLEKQS